MRSAASPHAPGSHDCPPGGPPSATRRQPPARFYAFLMLALAGLLAAACNYSSRRSLAGPSPSAIPHGSASPVTPAAKLSPAAPSTLSGTESAPSTKATCSDRIAFLNDVSVPDGARMQPGQPFTKTWRIRNDGTCTWNQEYSLVFTGGDLMGAPESIPLEGTVAPGSSVDLSVKLVAPQDQGSYTGNWALQNPQGGLFGLGSGATEPFWVQIEVGPKGDTVYSFIDGMCDALWSSQAGILPCPGSESDRNGFVVRLDAPRFEVGPTDNEPALETHPYWATNGAISGRYPAFAVQAGDRFKAVIGCRYQATACKVRFQLTYHANGGPLQLLDEWDQSYDGKIRSVSVDLTPLQGQSVEFSLVVVADGAPDQDMALWLGPRIVR
jgi:hypothetical protein